jgi:putative transposase
VKRAFRYRFYPTLQQAEQLNRTFGCVRLVYNTALDARTNAWTSNRRRVSYRQTSALPTDRHKLARAQRALSRRDKGSANRAKAKLKVARIHARIADRRRDHLHKLSTRLVRDNQTVVIEDLAVRNMVRNHCLARAISDAAWSQMRKMLEYKAQWYGRRPIVVDRWLPSSKLCSACGRLAESMPLNMREWTCPCGAIHDRDVNAARNILAAGLADSNACRGPVRPEPRKRGRRGPVKQEPPRATGGIPAL